MITDQHHNDISAKFLTQAREELDRGHILQASEKAWGTVAHCIRAISEQKGWAHNKHSLIHDNAMRLLIAEPIDQKAIVRFLAVSGLHQNFYEDPLDSVVARAGINAAKALIKTLKVHQDNGSQ